MSKKGKQASNTNLPIDSDEVSGVMERARFTSVYISACQYMVMHRATIRESASMFNLAKSTLHRFIHADLPSQSKKLYRQVLNQIAENIAVRHIRGGQATARKYAKIKIRNRK